jgi:integrase
LLAGVRRASEESGQAEMVARAQRENSPQEGRGDKGRHKKRTVKSMALFQYPGKKTWWYEFCFAGQKVRESAKTRSKEIARRAQNKRRREMEEGYHGLKKRSAPKLLKVAAEEWLTLKKPALAERSYMIEQANLKHILPVFGKVLITDIEGKDISHYQQERLEEGASPKTVNLEIGTLRAILRRNRLWAAIQPDVRMLPTRDDIGRAVTPEEEVRLLAACGESRSRSLLPAVTLAFNTCMRYSEIRLLRWQQVDFAAREITVGKSKTESGSGRVIPLNARAYAVLEFWASNFPAREPSHYVFPYERYGAAGDKFTACAYDTDPRKPIGRWKEAWEAAKIRAGMQARFHDLRHTGCTRMLEAGVPFPVLASLMGWSPATTVRMAKRYGHIGQKALRSAVEAISSYAPSACAKSTENPQGSFDNPFDLNSENGTNAPKI